MAIDFSQYKDIDFQIPANMYACLCCEIPDNIECIQMFGAYEFMSEGYLNAADELCKHIHSELKANNKDNVIAMIGPVIHLYYHAIELLTKTIAIKANIESPRGHSNTDILDKTLHKLSSDNRKYDIDIADKCRKFLDICDKHNMGSQFGRYPDDVQGQVIGLAYNESGDKEGYYVIEIMTFAYFMHQGADNLKKLYDNIATGSEKA